MFRRVLKFQEPLEIPICRRSDEGYLVLIQTLELSCHGQNSRFRFSLLPSTRVSDSDFFFNSNPEPRARLSTFKIILIIEY